MKVPSFVTEVFTKQYWLSEYFNFNVQGVQQNTFHFYFLNFSASYWSRNSILDIFQQPFPCRFQKYPISYYLVKPGTRYCQNTTGRSFQKSTFFLFIVESRTWAIISIHVHSGVLLRTQEHLGALKSMVTWCSEAHACSWHHAHKSFLGPMSAHDFSCHHGAMPISIARECSWIVMPSHECSWGIMCAYEQSWTLSITHDQT